MASSWLRQRWLWILAAVMVVVASGATVWAMHDSATPLERDCATVEDLGRQSHELTTWMNTGLDDGSLHDPGEIVEKHTALSGGMRHAANSVTTPELKEPLTAWANAMALFAQLQREANKLPPDTYPSREWVAGVQKYNTMTDEALDALDQQCPGVKAAVDGA